VPKLRIAPSGERDLVITRAFAAARNLVWDAHTKPELVRRWLLGPAGWTMPVCEIDLRVGGRFRYVWKNQDGREMAMGGVFNQVEPPERLVHIELFDEDWTGGETVVTQVFAESRGVTTLTMTIVYSSSEARAAALQTGMTDGMEIGYERLEQMLVAEPAR
jgi:uncharacterized protein YndB with AHSA1/START domain